MIDWAFVLTPLLVLPIALMFSFVGCSDFSSPSAGEAPSAVAKPPRYRDYIMAKPDNPGLVPHPDVKPNVADVIAYWRLVDDAANTVAKDEKGFQDGAYVTKSDAAASGFFTGRPGLITTDPGMMCRLYDGGYVQIPFKHELYTDEFTVEAWIKPQWGPATTGFEHVLFTAGGFYSRPFSLDEPRKSIGFTILVGKDNHWQVFMFPHVGAVFSKTPLVLPNNRTHFALTVKRDGFQSSVTLFVDGEQFGPVNIDLFLKPDGAPLLIAVNNTESSPDKPIKPIDPIIADVQEVVLYRKALSLKEVQNHIALNPEKV
jgi:hypothetical protein